MRWEFPLVAEGPLTATTKSPAKYNIQPLSFAFAIPRQAFCTKRTPMPTSPLLSSHRLLVSCCWMSHHPAKPRPMSVLLSWWDGKIYLTCIPWENPTLSIPGVRYTVAQESRGTIQCAYYQMYPDVLGRWTRPVHLTHTHRFLYLLKRLRLQKDSFAIRRLFRRWPWCMQPRHDILVGAVTKQHERHPRWLHEVPSRKKRYPVVRICENDPHE